MAGTVGRKLVRTLLNVNICKHPVGLYAVSSKPGYKFKSIYKTAVLQELKKPLAIKEQEREKLQKDEVSI
jgi:hypothetical protein